MGLYSTNRVSSVSAVEENTNPAVNEDSIDWTPDFSIGSVMEATIQIHENDAMMFDTLIECDFISVNNNLVMTEAEAEEANGSADSTKKSKIGEKIHNIIEAVINFIKKAAANAIVKIKDLLKADEKICDQYKDVLKVENLKDFAGIRDFAFPATVSGNKLMGEIHTAVDEFVNKANGVNTKEHIDEAYDKFKSSTDTLVKQMQSEVAFGFNDKVTLWKPTSEQLTDAMSNLRNSNKIIDNIKKHSVEIIGSLKKLQKDAKRLLKKTAETAEIEVYIIKKVYDVASESTKLFTKEFAAYNRTVAKQIAAYRTVVVLCGRAAAKAVKGEKPAAEDVKESAIMYTLRESSDAYVFECLGY